MHLAAAKTCCVKPLCQGVEAMWWLRLMRLHVGSCWGWGYPILEHWSRVASACFYPHAVKVSKTLNHHESPVTCNLWCAFHELVLDCLCLVSILMDSSLLTGNVATHVLFCFEFSTSAPSEAAWTPPNFRWTSLMLQRPGRRIHKMRTSPLHNARDGRCAPHVHDPNELASAPASWHA